MRDDKRAILKQLLRGAISGQAAARGLQSDGKTKVYIHIEHPNGLHYFDDEDNLTEAEYQERVRKVDPFGTMKTIVIGGRGNGD